MGREGRKVLRTGSVWFRFRIVEPGGTISVGWGCEADVAGELRCSPSEDPVGVCGLSKVSIYSMFKTKDLQWLGAAVNTSNTKKIKKRLR